MTSIEKVERELEDVQVKELKESQAQGKLLETLRLRLVNGDAAVKMGEDSARGTGWTYLQPTYSHKTSTAPHASMPI
ncbi:10746_t:CDS:2 [Paraglomus occultum]|uniref:10746_t:CDS:1 n=1 Tax=Paraglomus occultum TaxID=144539 RepID=A0A9N8YVC7_9GLOM|nr:10746_t:CDS:2 [Paraglomus occultum]